MRRSPGQLTLAFPPDSAAATAAFAEARNAARVCRACRLWEPATQTVFGEGPVPAPAMLIGEQPGDKEDRAGQPFVGPAGAKLNEALEEAGISRKEVYVTNAVKHFKYVPRGRIRLHQKPVTAEIEACRQWIERELDFVQPKAVAVVGATAAQALIAIHPSYILRIQEPADAEAEYARFVADLRLLLPFLSL